MPPGVEIVDFSESEDEDENDEGGKFFASSTQKRVIEALQTCPWPNISMKKDTEGGRVSLFYLTLNRFKTFKEECLENSYASSV